MYFFIILWPTVCKHNLTKTEILYIVNLFDGTDSNLDFVSNVNKYHT